MGETDVHAAAIRALEEWMDQAPAGDAETLAGELDDLAGDWGQWGTAPKSVIIDVLERCVERDFAEGNDVEFSGEAPDGRLGEFDVISRLPAAPTSQEREAAPSLLMLRAELSIHWIARLGSDRYGLLVHGGGIQELAGTKE